MKPLISMALQVSVWYNWVQRCNRNSFHGKIALRRRNSLHGMSATQFVIQAKGPSYSFSVQELQGCNPYWFDTSLPSESNEPVWIG